MQRPHVRRVGARRERRRALDRDLQRIMEPGASPPEKRLEAIATLARAGVPVGVLVAPVIPAVNDHEIPAILEAVAAAGGRTPPAPESLPG